MQVFRGMIWLLVAVFVVMPEQVSMIFNNIDDGTAPNELDRPSKSQLPPEKNNAAINYIVSLKCSVGYKFFP